MTDTIANAAAISAAAKIDAARAKITLGQTTLNEGVAELLAATAPAVEPPKEEPKPPVSGPVTTVKTLAALTTALKAAKVGEVIELATGEYGAYSLKGLIAPGVTVRAAGAKVTGLVLTACEGIAFEGLSADLAAGGVVRLDGCKDIDLIRLTSRNAKYYGVSILRSQDVRVIEADIADVKDGVQGANSRGVLVERCKIRRFRADGINMCGVSDLKVIGNDIAESLAGPAAHPDGVQLHTASADGPAENIEVIGNTFRRAAGQRFQGVFITDQTDGAKRYRNVVIRDNLIEGGMWNGIMVASASGVELTGNTVQPFTDMDSWIRIANCSGVRMDGNAYAQLLLEGVSGLDRRDKETLTAIAPR